MSLNKGGVCVTTIKLYAIYYEYNTVVPYSRNATCKKLDGDKSHMIDAGVYQALSSSYGAFSCRTPPVPRFWDCIDRPHVALLVPINDEIFPVFLSQPKQTEAGETLDVADLDSLPPPSMIEIRHNGADYRYYRRDRVMWTKVGESRNPFHVEVEAFPHAGGSITLQKKHN